MFLLELPFIVFFGSLFGSFASLIIYRLPRGQDIFFKRSKCDNCNKNLAFYELIPIFSQIFLKFKCLNCKKKIDVFYLFHELAIGIIFAFLYYKYQNPKFSHLFILSLIIYIITVIDLKYYLIFDITQLSLAILSFFCIKKTLLERLTDGLCYFLFAYSSSILVKFFKKRDAIGQGDLKFIFITGFFLSYRQLPDFFLIAGTIGVIFGIIWRYYTKQVVIPFIPCLAAALVLQTIK